MYSMTIKTVLSCELKYFQTKFIQGGAKATLSKKKLSTSIAARASELIFFSMIEACSRFISIKICLERDPLLSITIDLDKKFLLFTGRKTTYRMMQKSPYQKKLNISVMAWANELIFLPMIEACSSFVSIKTHLERTFVKYILFFLSVK